MAFTDIYQWAANPLGCGEKGKAGIPNFKYRVDSPHCLTPLYRATVSNLLCILRIFILLLWAGFNLFFRKGKVNPLKRKKLHYQNHEHLASMDLFGKGTEKS